MDVHDSETHLATKMGTVIPEIEENVGRRSALVAEKWGYVQEGMMGKKPNKLRDVDQ